MTLLTTYNALKAISNRCGRNIILSRHFTTGSETIHNASPRLPLLYYKASKNAMKSINHRVFYANWIFVFAAYDFFTTFVDF
ncbi:hypothetical protein MACK_003498 [Theileria orientalis]|uniref:Uncharacterized protein n=1 Tax=Theileria orientalis TaxID=68886 RepID=A0A976SJB1_THEOR|nr:hypothetical protein MACK_003498 [Theileria orientalis]